ncbi:hypothetical protein RSJ68_00970 [Neisseria sp. DTU_2020_1000833_1_SI_GRL_NUU_006]|nr:hypothetical protein RSJ68_00970 [Neisseria sp. DTU_2020_1000833_1_SI_GRL_NUU_006]
MGQTCRRYTPSFTESRRVGFIRKFTENFKQPVCGQSWQVNQTVPLPSCHTHKSSHDGE